MLAEFEPAFVQLSIPNRLLRSKVPNGRKGRSPACSDRRQDGQYGFQETTNLPTALRHSAAKKFKGKLIIRSLLQTAC